MNFRALARRLAAHGWEPLNTKLAPVDGLTAKPAVVFDQLGFAWASAAGSES